MNEKTLELLTHLKELVVTREEFARKHRLLLGALLETLDRKNPMNTSEVAGRAHGSSGLKV
ncbi:hypothetical protein ACVWZX_005382 [Deinococcus sp. UYEF24]